MSIFKIFTANVIYTYPNNMNIKHFFLSTILICLFESCKLNPQSQSTTQTVHPALYPIDAGTKGVAASRWPETPVADLVKGQSIYYLTVLNVMNSLKLNNFLSVNGFTKLTKWHPKQN